jgi:hypothetical protein
LEALTIASQHGSPVVVAGSLFLAADILALVIFFDQFGRRPV